LKETLHLAPDLFGRGLQCLAPGIDNDRPLWIQPFQLETHRLANAPPYAVARHGLPHCAWHGEADVRSPTLGASQAKSREERTGEAATFIIDFTKIFRPQDTDTFRKTRDGRLPFVANRQLLTSSSAAARKHSPAILGFHPAAKAMSLGALAIIRLKSAFRHLSSSI
jgi:hypothetical protein